MSRTSIESMRTTIDFAELERLPRFTSKALHLGSAGMGCFLEPPGHPTYFLQPVYNARGNSPDRGPEAVLAGHVVYDSADWVRGADAYVARGVLLRRLYRPLAWDHPRVEAWVHHWFQHGGNCYVDDALPKHDQIVVYPTPSYKLRQFRDDPRFNGEWRAQERAAIEAHNAQVEAYHARIATLDNHLAVRRVRQWYPDYPVDRMQALIDARPKFGPGNWYSTELERPTPDNCPGDQAVHLKHPTQGWCQWCGHGA